MLKMNSFKKKLLRQEETLETGEDTKNKLFE